GRRWPGGGGLWDHLAMGGPAERDSWGAPGAGPPATGRGVGPDARQTGQPGKVVAALAHGLGRYRFVLAGAAAVLLVLALLPASRPDRAAAGKPGSGSS